MQCDKCGAATKGKQITGKKDGKTYQVFECLGGCMSGNYPYSMFPPRDKQSRGGSSVGASAASSSQIVAELQVMNKTLLRIERIMANPGKINIAEEELNADKDLPEGF